MRQVRAATRNPALATERAAAKAGFRVVRNVLLTQHAHRWRGSARARNDGTFGKDLPAILEAIDVLRPSETRLQTENERDTNMSY